MANLGYADEYEAVLVNSRTQEALMYLPWSGITWQRLRNGISAGSVTVSKADGGYNCCGVIGGLTPWAQMLRIERNGMTVWDGPVGGWKRDSNGDLTIMAYDRMQLLMSRLVGFYRMFTNAAPGTIIRQLITDAAIGNPTFDPYTLNVSGSTAEPEIITREYRVERLERVYDCISEITDNTSTGFFSCVGDTVYTYESAIRLAMGLGGVGQALIMSDRTTYGYPTINVEGRQMATRAWAGGSGGGVNGFPLIAVNAVYSGLFLTSLLEIATASSRSGTAADLTLIAGRLAAESATPGFTLEKVGLSPDFGNLNLMPDLSNFIPGIQIDLDYTEESCAFNVPYIQYYENNGVAVVLSSSEISTVRMDQLDVTVGKEDKGGVTELFEASCRPTVPGSA